MKPSNCIKQLSILGLILAASVSAINAQSTWTNSLGGNWDDVLGWSAGVPVGVAANLTSVTNTYAVTNNTGAAVGAAVTVGNTLAGQTATLFLDGAGFNCTSLRATDRGVIIINTNATVTVSSPGSTSLAQGAGNTYFTPVDVFVNGGQFTLTTAAGGSVVDIDRGGRLIVNSGTVSLPFPRISRNTDGNVIQINGGTVTMGGFNGYRGGDSTTAGLVVNGATALLNVGGISLGTGNSWSCMTLNNGVVTNTGNFTLGQQTSGARGGRYLQTNGTYVGTSAAGAILCAANNNVATFTVRGGTATVEKFTMVNPSLTGCSATLTVSNLGTLYVGGGGIVQNAANTINLGPGGTLGAKADWSSASIKTLAGSATIQAADENGVARNIAISGALIGSGGLVKTGGGTLTLSGTNNYSGATLVSAGKLVTTTAATGAGSFTAASGTTLGVKVASAGSTLRMSSLTITNCALEFDVNTGNPSATIATNLGALTIDGTITVNVKGPLAVGGPFTLLRYDGARSGTGSFVLGTLPPGVIGSLNDDTVNQVVTLTVSSADSFISWYGGGGSEWDLNNAANLVWKSQPSATSAYYQENILGSLPVQLNDTTVDTSPVTLNLNTNVTPNSLLVSNVAKNYILTGTGSINGAIALNKVGAGTLTLQNTNNFTGGLNLNGGVVEFNANETLGGSASPVTFNGGTLRYATGTAGDFSTRTTTFAAGGATIDDNGNTVTLARPIGNNGAGSFTKTGTGILTLTGTNRYSGPTTIADGTLALATATTYISNTPAINLAGSATLSGTLALSTPVSQLLYGTGTVVGNLTVPTSTRVSPATNGVVGVLTNNGNLTVSGGTLSVDISTSTRDQIVMTGTFTASSGTVALNVTGLLTNGQYTLVQAGAITLGSSANLAVTGFAQAGKVATLAETGTEILLVVSSLGGASIAWQGDASLNYWDVETSTNWLNGVNPAVFVSGDFVTFNDSGSVSPAVDLRASLLPGGVIVSNATSDYTFSSSVSGKLSGTASLTKSGAAKLTITTANNNSGGTVINAGTIQIGDGVSAASLGTGAVANNGLLDFNLPASTSSSVAAVSGNGAVSLTGSGTVILSADNSYSGGTTIGAATLQVGVGGSAGSLGTGGVTNNGILVFNRTGTHTVANGITGSGVLQKVGTSVMTLGGVNDYQGNTYVSNGVVKLAAAEVIPDGGATTGWLILDGGAAAGALDLNGFNETVNALAGTGGASLGLITNSATSPTTTNTLSLNQAFSTTFAGLIADNPTGSKIAVAKSGIGSLTLSAANSFSGGLWIDGCQVTLNNGAAAGSGIITLTNAPTLSMGSGLFVGNPIVVTPGTTALFTSASTASGYNGQVSGDSTATLVDSSGAQWLSFSSGSVKQFQNFNGIFQIDSGSTLRFSSTSLGTNGGDNATFLVNGTLGTRNGTPTGLLTLGALEGSGSVNGGMTDDGAGTYLIGSKGVNSTFSGTVNGVGLRLVNIIKTGAGTQTFSGTLAYGGSTTISNGVLAITGTAELTNTSSINIRQAGTLDLTGAATGGLELGKTIAQSLTGVGTNLGFVSVAANSAIRAGNGNANIGTLTISGALTNNGTITMELNTTNSPTTNDLIAAASVVASGGTLIVTNVGPDLTNGQYFKLFSQPVSGAFTTVSLPVSNVVNTLKYIWQTNLTTDGSITLLSAAGAPTVATNPTNITFVVGGGNVTLSWPSDHTGWTLQTQTNTRAVGLNTNWFNVTGSTVTNQMQFPSDPANPTVFFRLFYVIP